MNRSWYAFLPLSLLITSTSYGLSLGECAKIAGDNHSLCQAASSCQTNQLAKLSELPEPPTATSDVNNNNNHDWKKLKIHRLVELAGLYVYNEETIYKGVFTIEEAHQLASQLPDSHEFYELRKHVLHLQGTYQLRLGELQNCLKHHNRDSCIFPLSKNAVHQDKHGSQAALRSFMEYLQRYGDNDNIAWLVNIAHQTLGTYPDQVPPQYLLPPERFAADQSIERFYDVAGPLGLQGASQEAGGSTVEDFNGDGYLDVMFASLGPCDPVLYFESDGKGRYLDKTASSGLINYTENIGLIPADYDNDGDMDLYLASGGWSVERDNYLLQNNGQGIFTDVTQQSGLVSLTNHTLGATWGDYNNDGWVDMAVCHEFDRVQLFQNQRGKFTEITNSGIVGAPSQRCKSAAWGDVNNDGLSDLFLSYHGSDNFLYLNQGGNKFKEAVIPEIKKNPLHSFVSWFFDYNNDGWLDLFVAHFNPGNGVQYYQEKMQKSWQGDHLRLFKNNRGQFQDVTQAVGLNLPLTSMGINFGDANNDGYPDIYIGTGGPTFDQLEPNRLLLNINGEQFTDATTSAGVGNLQKGHGISFADMDNDGDQDIFAQFGGAFPGDKFFPSLYENPGNDNHWLTLRLEGVNANRSAIGARVKVTVETAQGLRHYHQWVDHGGTFGSNSLQLEFGLGQASRIHSVEIQWRGDLPTAVYNNIEMDRIVKLREGETSPSYLALNQLQLNKTQAIAHGHRHH